MLCLEKRLWLYKKVNGYAVNNGVSLQKLKIFPAENLLHFVYFAHSSNDVLLK